MSESSSPATDRRPPHRVVGCMTGTRPGPTLICLGGVHGNEPAGLTALHRVTAALEKAPIARGEFMALAGNLTALGAGVRFVDRDLNRHWGSLQGQSRHGVSIACVEDAEQRELLAELTAAFERARGIVYVLDLHTTSGPGRPFTVFADTLRSRQFARRFASPLILGLEEHLDGTLVDYVASQGHVAAAFEGGQHGDPVAPDNIAAAIWIALASTGIVREEKRPQIAKARQILRAVSRHLPSALDIKHRHHIEPGDGFKMHPDFATFDRVETGQLLAAEAAGAVTAPRSGYLLMPLYQELGADGFFIVAPVRPAWLMLSRWLRLLRADNIVHWLPGVSRDTNGPDTFIVDRRVARWVALEILHLLGYRKLSEDGNILRVMRRQYDRS